MNDEWVWTLMLCVGVIVGFWIYYMVEEWKDDSIPTCSTCGGKSKYIMYYCDRNAQYFCHSHAPEFASRLEKEND